MIISRMSFGLSVVLLLVCGVFASQTQAAIVVDGRVGEEEGYSLLGSITPSKDANKVSDAKLYLHQDEVTFDLYVGVVLPLEFVDNSYGSDGSLPQTHTHSSWGGNKDNKHKFKHLLNSDDAEFVLTFGGEEIEFEIDYLKQFGNTYRADVVGGGDDDDDGDDDDGHGDDGAAIQAASSLEYNLENVAFLTSESPEVNLDYSTADPTLADWIFEVAYEFRIDGDVFNGVRILTDDGFADGVNFAIDKIHASPSKDGAFKDVTPNESFSSVAIPEPGVMAMAITGLIATGMSWGRRRERLAE